MCTRRVCTSGSFGAEAMKISLITVCFNGAAVIRTALDSVFAQAASSSGSADLEKLEIEYIVVDGGSTDGTVEILKDFAGKVKGEQRNFTFRWISEKDDGMYDAINKGIRMSTGEFVGILNADDYLDGNDVLARVHSFITHHLSLNASLDCVFGNVRFVREFGGKTCRVCFARFWRPWMLQWGYMPPHPAIFIRRAYFERWGGYVPERTEYRIAADYELLIRFFCRNKMPYRYMPINTTVMRLGGVSTKDVEARKKLNEEIIKGNRVNGYACYWPMLLPKYLIKIWEVILPKLGLIK